MPHLLHHHGEGEGEEFGEPLHQAPEVRVPPLHRLLEGVHVEGEGVRLQHLHEPEEVVPPVAPELGEAQVGDEERLWGHLPHPEAP